MGLESGVKKRHGLGSRMALSVVGEGGIRTHGSVATTPDFESDKICFPLC